MKRKQLKLRYKSLCLDYLEKFIKKHGYAFSYWTGGIGSIACFIDQYFFAMDDIIHDINTNQPTEMIFEWMDKCIDEQLPNLTFRQYIFEEHEKIKQYPVTPDDCFFNFETCPPASCQLADDDDWRMLSEFKPASSQSDNK